MLRAEQGIELIIMLLMFLQFYKQSNFLKITVLKHACMYICISNVF